MLLGKDPSIVPKSLQRILEAEHYAEPQWIGPAEAKPLQREELEAYTLAHQIMCHLCVQAPTKHTSGHPGGPLSSFTFAYFLYRRRNPSFDQPLRLSAGHLSLLAYGLQWLFGNEGRDIRLASPQAIIDYFRVPDGLPGHAEAGIGDIPFGAGPLGKGVSNGLGAAWGLKYLQKPGVVDVLMADGDCQEGQIMEAFRLAARLRIDNFVVHGDFNDIQLSTMPSRTVAPNFARIAEAAGWQVIEVQNGNDPGQVVAAHDLADTLLGKGFPIFICYYTVMGHGVRLMEEGSNTGTANYHGTPLKEEVAQAALKELPPLPEIAKKYEPYRQKFKAQRGTIDTSRWSSPLPPPPRLQRTITTEKGAARQEFGSVHIKNLMKVDPRIVVLHGDLAGSGGYDKVAKEFPDRVVNCGVAEANMYMMAAGLRQVGLLPVTYTFAAFGTNEARANLRLIDINLGHTHCGVLHDCTHAGVNVGEDGETHQERNYVNLPFDNTQVWVPADSNQAAAAAERALALVAEGSKQVCIFFPRSSHEQVKSQNGEVVYGADYVFDGKADLLRGRGDFTDQATVIASGITVHNALKAADELFQKDERERIQLRVLNISCIRPLDAAAVIQAVLETAHLTVVEDHNSEGGLATQVADVIADFQLPCSLRRLGVTHYFPSGTDKDLLFMAGLDSDSIANAVQDEIRTEVCGGEDALVTVVYALPENAKHSRFGPSVQPFLERLTSDASYLTQLRRAWEKRACPKEKLPTNEQLLNHLRG